MVKSKSTTISTLVACQCAGAVQPDKAHVFFLLSDSDSQEGNLKAQLLDLSRGRSIHDVVGYPRATLLGCCVMESCYSLHRLDIQVRNVGFAFGQLQPDLEFLVEHHVVLPQPVLAVVHTYDALLHLHLVRCASPRNRIVLPLLATGICNRHAALGEGQPSPRSSPTRGLRNFGGVTTPGVRCDTPGMC